MTKSAPPLVSAEDVLGFPDQADQLLVWERERQDCLDRAGRDLRRADVLRVQATRLRLRLAPEQARRYDALRATPR